MSVIPALGRLRQLDCEFKVSLGYIGRSCLKERKREKEKRREGKKEGKKERRNEKSERKRKYPAGCLALAD
jgi:hypothetical protein